MRVADRSRWVLGSWHLAATGAVRIGVSPSTAVPGRLLPRMSLPVA